jgi:hypothetical protein
VRHDDDDVDTISSDRGGGDVDCQGWEERHRLRIHGHRIVAAEILDAKFAFTASLDGKLVVFDLDTGTVFQEVRSGPRTRRDHVRSCSPRIQPEDVPPSACACAGGGGDLCPSAASSGTRKRVVDGS